MSAHTFVRELTGQAQEKIRTAQISPLRFTAWYLALSLLMALAENAVQYLCAAEVPSTPAMFAELFSGLVGIVLGAGYTCYCLGVFHNTHMPIATLFDGFSFAGKVILLFLLQSLYTALWTMLFIIPGIFAAYSCRFAMPILCEDPSVSPLQALSRSLQMSSGHRWTMFLIDLHYIPHFLAAYVVVFVYVWLFGNAVPDTLFGSLLDVLITFSIVGAAELYVLPRLNFAHTGLYLHAAKNTPQPKTDEGNSHTNF